MPSTFTLDEDVFGVVVPVERTMVDGLMGYHTLLNACSLAALQTGRLAANHSKSIYSMLAVFSTENHYKLCII